MRRAVITIGLFVFCISVKAQIDAGSVMGIPSGTTAQITAISTAPIGSCAFNTDDESIYWYSSSGWVKSTDDQDASEVDLAAAVDSDGDTTNETTVEEAVQAMAPITSASGRIFYPPSIAIDASTNGPGSVDLYQEYINQYAPTSTPYTDTFVASSGAPAIPTYGRTELYYYVTFYDDTVFGSVAIDANGNMSYNIVGQPADYNSLINVVFVVK